MTLFKKVLSVVLLSSVMSQAYAVLGLDKPVLFLMKPMAEPVSLLKTKIPPLRF
ncbi:hypothetical protein [Providencia hangzhouensis]|uniref:hypothetical protein n=1 Tax=Providencia hangzhouensis TaxID=3031799 RepID=UPI0034DCE575